MENPKGELIEIFAGSEVEAAIMNGLLQDAGITSFLKDVHIGTLAPWQAAAGGAGAVKLIINSNDYQVAKSIIEKYEENRNSL